MADERYFRARTDEARLAIEAGQEAYQAWHAEMLRVAEAIAPGDQGRKPITEESMGSKRFVGLEAVGTDYRDPPPGWRLVKSGWISYITPLKGKPKKGSDRPDMREQAKAMEGVGTFRDPRHNLPGIDNLAVQLPATTILADGTTLIMTAKSMFGPCLPHAEVWEEIKASQFHALVEANEEAKAKADA